MLTMSKLSFEEWMRAVNAELMRRVSMVADDLPDWRYRAAYDEGMTSKRAAAKAIQYAKREMGVG
jgi:Family of unknown function (DUF5419)